MSADRYDKLDTPKEAATGGVLKEKVFLEIS